MEITDRHRNLWKRIRKDDEARRLTAELVSGTFPPEKVTLAFVANLRPRQLDRLEEMVPEQKRLEVPEAEVMGAVP